MQMPLPFVSFLALVALEWSRHHVRSHVGFQIARFDGSKIALVTFERPLSCVLLHHVNFQLTSCNARILAHCASLWLFARVRLLVRLQVACFYCFVLTLIAFESFFPDVPLDMHYEVGSSVACIVALCAPVRFLSSVNEQVGLEGGRLIA